MALSTRTTVAEPTSYQSDQKNEQNGLQRQERYSGTATTPTEDWVPGDQPVVPRLIVSIEGEEKTGKDHFAFTAPGPIYLQSCDPVGSDGVRQKFPGKVYIPKSGGYQLAIDSSQCTAAEMKRQADPLLDKWISNYRAALPKFRTIVWDTADELWELCRLAKFGELSPKLSQGERNNSYGELNSFYEGLVKESFNYPVNFVLIHRVKDEYKANTKTGVRVRSGYKDATFLTQVNLRSMKVPKENGIGSYFGVQVLDCRRNPDIEGEKIENDFRILGMKVFPEVDPKVWL